MSGIDGDLPGADGSGDEDLEWLLLPAVVHQAIGMARSNWVSTRARHLRARARCAGRALEDPAEQVVTGQLD